MKFDLIWQTISYNSNNEINKILTEEYPNLDTNQILVSIDGIIFDRFTSHNIHLSDKSKKTYRIDDTVMTINQLKDFINTEEDKYNFLKKIKSDINNYNQQTFDFNQNNINCTTLEYDIPNEWVYHHGGSCSNNRYKFIIKVYF